MPLRPSRPTLALRPLMRYQIRLARIMYGLSHADLAYHFHCSTNSARAICRGFAQAPDDPTEALALLRFTTLDELGAKPDEEALWQALHEAGGSDVAAQLDELTQELAVKRPQLKLVTGASA